MEPTTQHPYVGAGFAIDDDTLAECVSVTPWGNNRVRWVRLRFVDGTEKSYAPSHVRRIMPRWKPPPTDAEMAEYAEWIRTRPAAVVAVMDRFPPACNVVAKPGRKLVVPSPGVLGKVSGYTEEPYDDGTRVVITVAAGEWYGDCDPDWLDATDSEESFFLYRKAKRMAGL